jgi:hypothetical protein
LNQPTRIDAKVVAQRDGKQIQHITRLPIEFFEERAELMKETANQIGEAIDAVRKTLADSNSVSSTQVRAKQGGFSRSCRQSAAHCVDCNGDDFRVRNFDARVLPMTTHLEKIINQTVYCKSAIAHLRVLFFLNLFGDKILREGFSFFQISNSITGNLGSLVDL